MISCNFLLKISEALTEAKQKMSAFRGMNIIFAGNFAQLPPVQAMHLLLTSILQKQIQKEVNMTYLESYYGCLLRLLLY